MRLLLAARVFALSALAIGCDEQVYIQVNPPMIAVNTDALDFGEIPLDATVDRSLSILNAGGETLAVGRLYVHGAAADAFSLEAPRLSVPPGKEREVRVRFAPRVLGDASATLEIPSNAHNAPEESVALLGRGVEASVCGPCDDPPDPRCLTELNRVRYDPNGLCVDDQCRYQAVVEACAERCDPDNAACVGGVLDAGQRDGTAPADAGSDSAQLPDAGEALCEQAACNPPGPHFHLADTNQRTCYDDGTALESCPMAGADFFGQDAQHGWDTTHAASARFSRDGYYQPVVTDGVTGLVWQGCAAGLSGSACATGTAVRRNWRAATDYCAGLSWGGYDDWALPDIYELHSIVDLGGSVPAIDAAAFPATPATPYRFWSSSLAVGACCAWEVAFQGGSIEDSSRDSEQFVRCLRRNPAGPAVLREFTRQLDVAAEPVVRDSATGLMWQGCAAGLGGASCAAGTAQSLSWKQALAYCEGLSWGGHDDWRLPDVKELESLVDIRRAEPALDTTAFPGAPLSVYWSSTTRAAYASSAYAMNNHQGSYYVDGKFSEYGAYCVRAGD